MRTAMLIMIGWLLAGVVRAEEPGRQPLFDRASAIRLEVERLDDARKALAARRDALAGRLDALAVRIRERKQARTAGGLLPDFTLQDLLRSSQELSGELTLLNKELEALEQLRRDRLERLYGIYGRLIGETTTEARNRKGARRAALLDVLGRLRTERRRVERALAVDRTPPPPMDTDHMLASDDPEELTEQADAVRDEQDRLRRRLASLGSRIQEAEAECRLEREMNDFQEDQELFAEDSRFIRATRTTSYSTEKSGGSGDHDASNDEPATHDGLADDYEGGDPDVGSAVPAGECAGGFCGTPGESGGAGAEREMVTITATEAGRLPVGVDADAALERLGPADRLRVLGRQRRRLVTQIKKLQILHDQLLEKIDHLRDE